ncbi:MAG: type III pantothenate kinase [Peptococcaceae bacterium]|nr:type III pantothenate kinase [Peptococcaceae bacterium]
MLLAVDIGNSNIVMAVYQDDRLLKSWRITTDRNKTEDEYELLFEGFLQRINLAYADLTDVAIASVVPPVNTTLERLFRRVCNFAPLVVTAGIKTGLRLKVDDPRGLGADRIVNAVAAYELYGGPLIIVDLGTATTVCAVTATGDFLGGVICPGLGISVDALSNSTAKLPFIDIVPPPRAIGKNTIDSMHSGIYFGYVGLVEGLVKRFKRELDGKGFVVATGGFAPMIGKGTNLIDKIEPNLTLEGLKFLQRKNYPR